ncbi:PREDICTED: probable inactive receptor-like protein kinase At3g56050 isoform X2 [Camelina sativa]|uniref:Probable inactive receptor-like protein kinase At3g56050 isoform X2 n=1 Tax=Camelina sativa TaxID=90675 RepID=A0ABM0VBS7_CAMSA|nr:PREDICTED: probable inactive receptor-like protein kinase At3g56050 isoform X2 [Camelina sativa]
MRSNRRWGLNLPIIIFLTYLPLKLKSQEIAEVFDSSQDNSLIQSRVNGNRRILIDAPFPGKGPALDASPPSPESATFRDPLPPPPPPEGDETPSPPQSGVPAQTPKTTPPAITPLPVPSAPSPSQSQSPPPRTKTKSTKVFMIVGIVVGVFTLSGALIIFFLIFSRKIPIKPWSNSGQLQDALLTGKHTLQSSLSLSLSFFSLHIEFLLFCTFCIAADVPRLQLSELQAACEDFSNVIGSFSDGTIYKGTLSTGAEIAVVSAGAGSRAAWSTAMETQLLQKVPEPRLQLRFEQGLTLPLKNNSTLFLQLHKLSKVDHKNFLNVIGYCHEEEPFSRMLVFEYAPNGCLSEHLHSQHAEHLDWPTRLRILMGIAYCLEHMHNLNPPILHTSLDSSSVYLTEDNAAKVSDFSVINSIFPSQESSSSKNLLECSLLDPQTDVFNFGVVLFEIISAQLPDPDSLFFEPKPARDIVDPTLETFQEDTVERLLEVVRQCMNPYPAQRPTMIEVVVKLREITGIEADAAMPRLSPRWWTELEIISTEGN